GEQGQRSETHLAKAVRALERSEGGYMAWWKKRGALWKLLGKRDSSSSDANTPRVGDLYVAPAPETAAGAEAALAGTASMPRLLTLVPPPIDPELRPAASDDTLRYYGPDPIAEYALAIPARAVFSIAQLSSAITQELRRYFALPVFYVRTPEGRVTYM